MKLNTPSSTLTRTADTNAYAAGDLVATTTTAGSIVVPSFEAGRIGGRRYYIPRIRLASNKTSGMGSIGFTVRLWLTAPTYNNGDNGAYSIATNEDQLLDEFTITSHLQGSTGSLGIGVPIIGDGAQFYLSGTTKDIYWDLEIESALTPASAQTFTLYPEVYDLGA